MFDTQLAPQREDNTKTPNPLRAVCAVVVPCVTVYFIEQLHM
jgi:hypothetical protein